MQTQLTFTGRALRDPGIGFWFVANNRWRMPVMAECVVWDVLSGREDKADQYHLNNDERNQAAV